MGVNGASGVEAPISRPVVMTDVRMWKSGRSERAFTRGRGGFGIPVKKAENPIERVFRFALGSPYALRGIADIIDYPVIVLEIRFQPRSRAYTMGPASR